MNLLTTEYLRPNILTLAVESSAVFFNIIGFHLLSSNLNSLTGVLSFGHTDFPNPRSQVTALPPHSGQQYILKINPSTILYRSLTLIDFTQQSCGLLQ
jgi:hypothetical protein